MQTDLFGRSRKPRKSRLRSATERYDRETLEARVDRLAWLQKVFPHGYSFGMPFESSFVFDEAKMAFLNGQFVGAVLLATAFIEHRLSGVAERHGFVREARRGLKRIVKCLRTEGLVDVFLLDKVDRLRLRRNPFVHLKEFDHPHRLTQRALGARGDPLVILEADAKDALSLMYSIAVGKGGSV